MANVASETSAAGPERWLAAVLMAGLPALVLVIRGAPVMATSMAAAAIAGLLVIIHS